jgi:hypothetical protein
MPKYFAFLRRLQLAGEILWKFFQNSPIDGKNSIIDSTSISTCKDIHHSRSKLFPPIASWVFSATKTVFGIKLHLVIDEKQKATRFSLTNGFVSDVSEAFHLLETCSGTTIGDKGSVSENLRSVLVEKGVRFIARTKKIT